MQVLEEEVAIVGVEQLSKSLGVVAEVASRGEGGTEDTRDTALANEAVKVLLSKCLGRGLTRERVRIIATLLPLAQNGEAGLTQVLDGLERPQTHVLPSGGIQLSQTLRETPSISLWLALLCSVGDSLFPSHPFLSSAQFWQIVQAGLKHEDPLPRKRALYLLRRATQSGAVFSTDLLFPQSSTLPTLLNSYFLVLDTLEEKQPHLVRQLLPRLEELFSSCCAQVGTERVINATQLNLCKYFDQVSASTPLHVSWVLIAYERLFHHPSVSLVRWGLESFLRLPWNQPSLGSMHFQNFLTSSLLEVLNQNKIYCGGEGDEDADATFTASDYFPDQNDLKLTGQVVANALSNFLNRCFTLLDGKSGDVVR